MDRSIIERYSEGAGKPAAAITGLAPADLNAFPVPGTWSIQQIVIHLMDSDLIASDRMKRVAAEDRPLIVNYDETAFAQRLMYDRLDPHLACDIFQKNRQITAQMLRALPDSTFERAGIHTRTGLVTLAGLVEGYTRHLDHHLKFLYDKRRLLGKAMA